MPARNSFAQGAHLDVAQPMHLVGLPGKRQVDYDGAEVMGSGQLARVLLDSQVDQSAADISHHDHFNGRNRIKRQDASKHRIDVIRRILLFTISPFVK